MVQTRYCARHSKRETNIRCGRCDTPICPDCLVHAPVGMRCPDCAKVNKVPTYDVPFTYVLRAIAAGVITAFVLGIAYTFAARYSINLGLLGIPIFNLLLPYLNMAVIVAIGFATGEAISLAVNRKRGNTLKVISGCSMLIGAITAVAGSQAVLVVLPLPYLLIALGLALWLAIRRF